MKMRASLFNGRIFLLAVIVIVGGLALAAGKTVLWKWKDAKGFYHYVDELYKVPEKYRERAERIEIDPPPVQPLPKTPPPKPKYSPEQIEEAKNKAAWQAKARNAVAAVKRLENEVKKTGQQCMELQRKWASMPVLENQQAVAKCNQNLEQLRAGLQKARDYKRKGLYKEAQEAGIPINWFDAILEEYEED